ncbi:hypothetical protein Bbelb_032410 [Branchiostoma belcheri]|nr:hypothetical protein Bbelb_032410 [Branchiostoma belcheri]
MLHIILPCPGETVCRTLCGGGLIPFPGILRGVKPYRARKTGLDLRALLFCTQAEGKENTRIMVFISVPEEPTQRSSAGGQVGVCRLGWLHAPMEENKKPFQEASQNS